MQSGNGKMNKYEYLYEERAAILEYDAGYSRAEAEKLARIEIEKLKKEEGKA